MKRLLCILLTAVLLTGCTAAPVQTTAPAIPEIDGEVRIRLSDEGIQFPADSGVQTTKEDTHTVVHITQPGTYRISGKLSAGQIAVDLGEGAQTDPGAVVTLILDNAEVLCQVAPAVIFYRVYECGDAENPTGHVDTTAAGANVVLADGSENRIVGSHTEEYDGAFYSKMSLNIGGAGSLRIEADNEGLCSEMHLTLNGGEIYIESGNDGINANADGKSVITINAGRHRIAVNGSTGEGDGIDSNGWLVINGGQVEACACSHSMDGGLDADLGIEIHGGTVIATGNMLDQIAEGGQTHLIFSFQEQQTAPSYTLKDAASKPVLECQTPCAFTNLLLSAPELTEGTYTLWSGDIQYEGISIPGGGFGLIQPIERPEFPGKGDDGRVEIPPQPTQPIVTHGTVQPPPGDDRPADMPVAQFPQGSEGQMPVPPMPPEGENMPMPQLPEGVEPSKDGFDRQPIQVVTGVCSTDFPVTEGANYFMNVRAVS